MPEAWKTRIDFLTLLATAGAAISSRSYAFQPPAKVPSLAVRCGSPHESTSGANQCRRKPRVTYVRARLTESEGDAGSLGPDGDDASIPHDSLEDEADGRAGEMPKPIDSSPLALEAQLSSSLTNRMLQLGLDPATERAAASTIVEESVAVVLDANEVKRRYYEEFFKARALRGIRPFQASTNAAEPPDDAEKKRERELRRMSALRELSQAPEPLELPRGTWYSEAEARHGRTAMLACLYWVKGSPSFCPFEVDWNAGVFRELPLPVLADEYLTGHLPDADVFAIGTVFCIAVALEVVALITTRWTPPSTSESKSPMTSLRPRPPSGVSDVAPPSSSSSSSSAAAAVAPPSLSSSEALPKCTDDCDSTPSSDSLSPLATFSSSVEEFCATATENTQSVLLRPLQSLGCSYDKLESLMLRLKNSEAIHGRIAMAITAPVLYGYATAAVASSPVRELAAGAGVEAASAVLGL